MIFMCYHDCLVFFFFKQKTAYEMRISDWSSDVCSSDLLAQPRLEARPRPEQPEARPHLEHDRARPLRADLRAVAVRPRGEEALPAHIGGGVVLDPRHVGQPGMRGRQPPEIGRASCRERVCTYV